MVVVGGARCDGTYPFMGLYMGMEQGTVTQTSTTPEAVARVVGSSPELLIGLAMSLEGSMTY